MFNDIDENKFVELISDIPNVAVQGYDKDRKVIYWNKASEDIYGYSKDEAIGKKLEDLIIPDFMREDVIGFIKNWYEKGEVIPSSELPLRHKNGSTVYVYSSHVMLNQGTDNPEMFCVDIDLTKQKEQEQSLKKQDELIVKQARMAQMGEMISIIAHQWKQPLGAISATTANLQIKLELESEDITKSDEKEGVKKYLVDRLLKIDGYIQNLTETMDDFRNFYSPNKKFVIVKLENIVEKALTIMDPSLKNHNIKVEKKYSSNLAIEIYDNEMTQVIINILKNSIDNFKEKRIKNPFITITTNNRIISICDNGGGIPEDIIKQIFDLYFSTKNEIDGSGLGLYMSKVIVQEHHNGTIEVQNSGVGTCFRIEIGEIRG